MLLAVTALGLGDLLARRAPFAHLSAALRQVSPASLRRGPRPSPDPAPGPGSLGVPVPSVTGLLSPAGPWGPLTRDLGRLPEPFAASGFSEQP
jgi:hypothetical protein